MLVTFLMEHAETNFWNLKCSEFPRSVRSSSPNVCHIVRVILESQ